MPQEIKHQEREHALLSASSAKRWIACTPSAKLCDMFGVDKGSAYAAEGTLAHEISELYIRAKVLHTISDEEFNSEFSRLSADKLYKPEMLSYVAKYVDYCREQYLSSLSNDESAEMHVETKVVMTEYAPDSFGTADCIVFNEDTIEVIDLKYGKGVQVSATHNEQLMMYALGAYEKFKVFNDFKQVRMTIVQPRLDSISRYEMSTESLLSWANETLRVRAALAYHGVGELVSGSHCQFCGVKSRCRALYENTMRMLDKGFEDANLVPEKDLIEIFKSSKRIELYLKSVYDYMFKQALNGKDWDGFKLVHGRSIRKWKSEDEVSAALAANKACVPIDILYTIKLNSISEVEKAVGKKNFEAMFKGAYEKSDGAPTLVPEDDKREAIDRTKEALTAFESEDDLD